MRHKDYSYVSKKLILQVISSKKRSPRGEKCDRLQPIETWKFSSCLDLNSIHGN
ncbi:MULTISPECIES: hypothetical protein [unclassified Moorena]|uniref:hypothetical protein n=1 Tax=unclassified Moorena TaxID=2683338 RepID=UPI0014004D3D|nr:MULTISPECIES: hypothetical protein [unclassified Moorena]NEO12831.1 hypothetical protein [Moorena sp. SIO3E8]NEQ01655.1 hypothetical protein [Moorena sp. SIO3F7]